jgi:hypothetical protein
MAFPIVICMAMLYLQIRNFSWLFMQFSLKNIYEMRISILKLEISKISLENHEYLYFNSLKITTKKYFIELTYNNIF